MVAAISRRRFCWVAAGALAVFALPGCSSAGGNAVVICSCAEGVRNEVLLTALHERFPHTTSACITSLRAIAPQGSRWRAYSCKRTSCSILRAVTSRLIRSPASWIGRTTVKRAGKLNLTCVMLAAFFLISVVLPLVGMFSRLASPGARRVRSRAVRCRVPQFGGRGADVDDHLVGVRASHVVGALPHERAGEGGHRRHHDAADAHPVARPRHGTCVPARFERRHRERVRARFLAVRVLGHRDGVGPVLVSFGVLAAVRRAQVRGRFALRGGGRASVLKDVLIPRRWTRS